MNKILRLFGIKKTYNKKRNTTFYYAEKYNFTIRITSKIGFYIGTKDNTVGIYVFKGSKFSFNHVGIRNGWTYIFGYNISWNF